MRQSLEPLERVTINLYKADVAWFRKEYGFHTVKIREVLHDFVKKQRTIVKVTEPYLMEDFDD